MHTSLRVDVCLQLLPDPRNATGQDGCPQLFEGDRLRAWGLTQQQFDLCSVSPQVQKGEETFSRQSQQYVSRIAVFWARALWGESASVPSIWSADGTRGSLLRVMPLSRTSCMTGRWSRAHTQWPSAHHYRLYRPRNCGVRFSRMAAMPSLASSVVHV